MDNIHINLKKLESLFLKEATSFLKSERDDSSIYSLDLFVAAIVNRSLSLIMGFTTLSKADNYIAAVPLIRIQLDNCLRFYAAALVEDYNDFFSNYLKGIHIRNMKDIDGKLMTDSYLIQKLDKQYPGLNNLYKNTSGHVHLSNQHTFLQAKIVSEKDRTISFQIGGNNFHSIGEKVDFAYNMFIASKTLLEIIKSWTQLRTDKVGYS